jgi:hypothetical protein
MSKPLNQYDIRELKLVYRTLHRALTTESDLMDSELMADLQEFLHTAAEQSGVDPTDHAALDRWLGNPNAMSCADRAARMN